MFCVFPVFLIVGMCFFLVFFTLRFTLRAAFHVTQRQICKAITGVSNRAKWLVGDVPIT